MLKLMSRCDSQLQPSKTIFTRISYDPVSDTSVVRCRPVTGRSHQLRVHLQYLGYPIANDPIYSDKAAWGEAGGKGGLFQGMQYRQSSNGHKESVSKMVDALAATFTPSLGDNQKELEEEVSSETASSEQPSRVDSPMEPPTPPSLTAKEQARQANEARKQRKEKNDLEHLKIKHPEFNTRKGAALLIDDELQGGSEVKLVPQAIKAIKHLRKVRDEEDNFARYRDMERPPMPPDILFTHSSSTTNSKVNKVNGTNRPKTAKRGIRMMTNKERESLAEEVRSNELIKLQNDNPEYYIEKDGKARYCNVCGTPLLPDPRVDQLSIWLHAIRYCK